MDEQKNNQDLTVGLDGVMNEANNSEQIEKSVQSIAPTPAPKTPVEEKDPQVNTVMPPPQDESVKLPEEAPVIPESDSSSSGVVEAPADMQMASAPEIEAPHTVESSNDTVASSKNDASKEPTVQSQQSMNSSKQQRPHEHRNNKKLAILVTVLVAVILSVIAVFVYLSTEDNTNPVPLTTQPESALPLTDTIESSPTTDPTTTNDPTLNNDINQPIGETEPPLSEPVGNGLEESPVPNDPVPSGTQ